MKTNKDLMENIAAITKWIIKVLEFKKSHLIDSGSTFTFILIGSILIFPLVSKLPLVGWDWYYFFNANNPVYNIFSKNCAYPPFAQYIIQLFTWMDWRTSLGLLNSITIMSITIATWKNGGKYFSIVFALTMPPLWFLMWVGHPDGLVLLGLITGIIPLIIMKPILSVFALLSKRNLFIWSIVFVVISLLIWPDWFTSMGNATMGHETDIGWAKMGWPLLILGGLLVAGAGKDPYRLMAAGCFITPYLMPYHMTLIIPAVGKTRGWRQIVVWLSSWFVFLGTGLQGNGQFLSFVFPLTIYLLTGSVESYLQNVRENIHQIVNLIRYVNNFGAKFKIYVRLNW
jgi:hypothetical protein